MTENVNYEDNLFFISQITGLVEKSLKLNLDSDLFCSKIIEDIFFVDRTLQHIFKNLSENSYLINRNQYLHSLMKKKKRYITLLEDFLNSEDQENIKEEDRATLQRVLEVHSSDIGDIREILSLTDKRDEGRDIISRDELNFLMAPGLLDEDEPE